VHLVGFLFIVVIADARNHEPETLKQPLILKTLEENCVWVILTGVNWIHMSILIKMTQQDATV
jgi:hypothetical protein